MVPGSNLLNRAARLIGLQTVQYEVFTGSSTNEIGLIVPTFAAPVPVLGSVQPIARTIIQAIGLDWQKNYVTLYTSHFVNDVARDQTGDQFTFAGKTFQVLSKTDWTPIDGWTNPVCVQIS